MNLLVDLVISEDKVSSTLLLSHLRWPSLRRLPSLRLSVDPRDLCKSVFANERADWLNDKVNVLKNIILFIYAKKLS